MNIVGPIVKLLDTQRDQIENFEGLIALNELASASEKYRYTLIRINNFLIKFLTIKILLIIIIIQKTNS